MPRPRRILSIFASWSAMVPRTIRCALLSPGVFCCVSRVALQNYVSTFRDIAASDPNQKVKPLDDLAIRRLMTSPRLVQEAVLLESQHAGHHGVECLGCSGCLCVLL